jgi:hypothetical protein
MIHVQFLFEYQVESDCCKEWGERVQIDDQREVDVGLTGIIEDR